MTNKAVANGKKHDVVVSPDAEQTRPTMMSARNMSDFGAAFLAPFVEPLGLRPEKMFFPLGLCLVHSFFLFGIWTELSGREEPAAFMHGWISCEWVAILTALYLVLVFVGPRLMEGRPAADIKEWMVVYNFYQTALNAFMVVALVGSAVNRGLELQAQGHGLVMWAQPVKGTPALMVLGLYVHFNNKFIEYLDTLFMVLRHKTGQLTFLHCWHHFLMGFAWFCVLKNAAGGAAWYGSTANSFIHVIMYGYYGLRSVGVKLPTFLKAAVTQAQLLQFFLVSLQSFWGIHDWLTTGNEVYPIWLTLLQLGVMVNMFVMFSGFYIRAYLSKPSKKDAAAAPKAVKSE
ncbi:hypothetical protein FNF27_07308 [Cafeteria roenbergensis]|uniref:Elongation of fatty acids protein n=1 Tax=Cafeteria roenbergensis TaxID=33653 RepID=A0A5A8DPY3_CAFRO|nr:hypothetical protein FNF27_07308 [Cafeteria roenbergensis]